MSTGLAGIPRSVRVMEVGPRDGLQNEAAVLSTDDKVRFVDMLSEAGYQDIEVTSFVSPKRVPQLADAESVFRRIKRKEGVRYWALVPNHRGLARAIEAGVDCVAFFTAASDSFVQHNIGMTQAESLSVFRDMMPTARANGMRVRGYVSSGFVCPFEGIIPPAKTVSVVQALCDIGVDEVSVGDTVGHAVPTHVAALTELLLSTFQTKVLERLAYHFHDTRGSALANVLMAMEYGISRFDASAGGAGGCPFAPGAAGNLATEDLVYMLNGMGIDTGIDIEKVVAASRFVQSILYHTLPSRYLRATFACS